MMRIFPRRLRSAPLRKEMSGAGPRYRFSIGALLKLIAASACILAVFRWVRPAQPAPQPQWDPFESTRAGSQEWGAAEAYYNRILDAVARGEAIPEKHMKSFLRMSLPRLREITGREEITDIDIMSVARFRPSALRQSWPPKGKPASRGMADHDPKLQLDGETGSTPRY